MKQFENICDESNDDICADIVISGRFFDEKGQGRSGALAVRDGRYLAVGDGDSISQYIGLDTIMCGYRNKSVLAGLYTAATGVEVQAPGERYRSDGRCQIVVGGPVTIKVGEPANLVVYDDESEIYSESRLQNAKVLLRIVDGKIIYRKKEKVKKAAFLL